MFKRKTDFLLLLLGLLPACGEMDGPPLESGDPELAQFRCSPFTLRDITLLNGPFRDTTRLNVKSLLQYEPERLLAKFRQEAGLEPRPEHLPLKPLYRISDEPFTV
jgi:hypothetical protein